MTDLLPGSPQLGPAPIEVLTTRARHRHRAEPSAPAGSAITSHLRVPLYRNTYALVVSGVLTTVIGLAFWALAARFYPAQDVGRASAAISTMTMVAALFQLNLSSGMMRFLPEAGRYARILLLRAYGITTLTTTLGAVIVVLVFSGHTFLSGLQGPDEIAFKVLFVIAVPLWSLFAMQDAALIGLRSATYVPIENLVFSLVKLGLLIPLVAWPVGGLLAAWTLPAALLIVPVSWLLLTRILPAKCDDPVAVTSWTQVRGFLFADFSGSLLEILTAAAVPIIVTWQLGLEAGAYFYTSWVGLVGGEMVLESIGSSLTVEGAHDSASLNRLKRSAGRLAALFTLVTVPTGIVLAPFVLNLIGANYASNGVTLLRLLLLGLPLRAIVVLHLSSARVQRRGRTIVCYQAAYALLLFVSCLIGLKVLGVEAVGWAFLAIQALLVICIAVEKGVRRATRRSPA